MGKEQINHELLGLHNWIMGNREIYHLLKVNIIDERQIKLHPKHYMQIMSLQLNLDKAVQRKNLAIKTYLIACDEKQTGAEDLNVLLQFVHDCNDMIKKLMLFII